MRWRFPMLSCPERLAVPASILFALFSALPGALGATEPPSCLACRECARSKLAEIEQRGWLGMALHLHPRPGREGLEIQFVDDDGPAAEVGLRPGDLIVSVQGVALADQSSAEVVTLLQGLAPGHRVALTAVQKGEWREITLTARPMPLKAKALALGTYFIRELTLEADEGIDAERSRSPEPRDTPHPPM